MGVLAKEDKGFLGDEHLTHHQPLPLAWLRGQLAGGGSLTNGWLCNHFGLLRWTIHLLGQLPFSGRVGLARCLRSLLFLLGSLGLDVSLSPALFHFCTRVDR